MSVELRTGSLALSAYSKKYPWVGNCDREGCYYFIAGETREEVEHKVKPENHRCPLKGSTHMGEMKRPKNGYERIWDELDETVSILKDSAHLSVDEKEKEKRYAQGLAFALAAIGQYQLTTVEQINKEANKRWKWRTGQAPFTPTQGYTWGLEDDTPAWEHPNNEYWRGVQERARKEAAEARANAEAATPTTTPRASARAQRASTKKQLTEQQIAAIRMAKAMIPSADLAKMYGCTVADIEAVV